MSVKLQKEHIRLSETICSKYCQTTVESDIIVPDVKPDILKILQVDSEVVINQKNVQTDKVYVQGIIRMNVIYAPDTENTRAVKSISTSQEFNHSVDIKDAMPGMEVCIDAETDPAEYTLVNSRKLSIRNKVGLCVRIMGAKELEIATGIDEELPVETKHQKIKIYNPCIDTVRDIIIRERLEVPAGKPAVCEVIKFSAKAASTELRLMASSAVVKGELKICTLYCGEGDGAAPEVMEHTVPFSEVLEIDGLSESMNGEIDYTVKDFYFEICQDSDGDKRILSCEFTLEAAVRAFETLECNAIEDAYGLTRPIEIKKSAYNIEQFIGSSSEQVTVKEQVNIPDYLPEVQRLCECGGIPSIESVSIDDNCVTVSGYITCNFLYLSGDGSMPVSGFAHVLPFSHTFEMEGLSADSVCDAKAETEHISCTISGGKAFEVRAIVKLFVKAVKPFRSEVISEVSCCDDASIPKHPSIVAYFVQKGDTLWDIAKRYHISPDAIVTGNGAENEIIKPGKCIYIFR